jgi:hypothetical protein
MARASSKTPHQKILVSLYLSLGKSPILFPGHSSILKLWSVFSYQSYLSSTICRSYFLSHFLEMPILNGDAMADTSPDALDFTKALEVLKSDYPERDGIDVKTLINSKENGGLTYNDFLVLPGYIGMSAQISPLEHAASNRPVFRLPCL